MKVNILIVWLCFLSINALAQNISITTFEDIVTNLPQKEVKELEMFISGERSFMSSYSDGTIESYIREDNNKINVLFMEGYFSPSIIAKDIYFSKVAKDIEVISINLHEKGISRKVKFDLDIFKSLKYIVINSFEKGNLLQVEEDFKALSKGDRRQITVVSNLMEQTR